MNVEWFGNALFGYATVKSDRRLSKSEVEAAIATTQRAAVG